MSAYKILCGRLYDGIHDELQPDMEILVSGDKIREVGRKVPAPEDVQVIDLSDRTVTPGMIDAHVHASFFDWREIDRDAVYYSNGMRTLAVAECARKALMAGFTTIRHVGWFREDDSLAVKRAIEMGYIQGARMVVAPHFLCTPGSHGDSTQKLASNPALSRFLEDQYPTMGSGPDFFRDAVRHEVKLGADFIKIMATGGFFTPNDSPEDVQLSRAELEAIIHTARDLHVPVTAHAYTPGLITTLAELGISGIEHASLIDEPACRLLEEKGIYVVPTFCPYDEIVLLNEEKLAQKPEEFQKKLYYYRDRLVESRKILMKSSLKLGYGTDLVTGYNNYECGREYSAWLRNGMDPFRALKAATSVNADILGIGDRTGTIEPGKLADLAGWGRDLLNDDLALLDCSFVMKEGTVYPTISIIGK
ncbi:MAG TPA: amidohydrolase family protein [Candidatus Enterocloster faecavium]|uniref:Amidohydrolase family protein n=1 Tax=Candidatus Enterocloster faecavium TaxID=2838560 RepID=A0A9D2L7Z9_9FIRM|nr:amidohydrolase family protein [Candidatus Enterocloster faecavium]